MESPQAPLGELISLFFEEYLVLYKDEELASVAAAATINELLSARRTADSDDEPEIAC